MKILRKCSAVTFAIKNLNTEQVAIQSLLDASAKHLASSRLHVDEVQNRLKESRKLSSLLSDKIEKNTAILDEQKNQIY